MTVTQNNLLVLHYFFIQQLEKTAQSEQETQRPLGRKKRFDESSLVPKGDNLT